MIAPNASRLLIFDQIVNRVMTIRVTDHSHSNRPPCPRCGGTNLSVCGESVQYRAEERPNQPLSEREVRTIAYKCECGLGFTETSHHDSATDESP